MKNRDVVIVGGLAAAVLLSGGRTSARSPSPTGPAPLPTPPRSTVPPSGWIWPLPTIVLDALGQRALQGVVGVMEFQPVISNPFAPSKGHDGVDVDYQRLTKFSEFSVASVVNGKQRMAYGYKPRITDTWSTTTTPAKLGESRYKYSDSHDGTVGFFCPPNVLCCAVADGVVWTSEPTSTRGAWVLIDHGAYTTYYTHLSSTTVPKCTGGKVVGTQSQFRVTRGQVIGTVGYDPSTPTSTVRHLHFQMATYPGGVKTLQDPAPVLRAATSWRA